MLFYADTNIDWTLLIIVVTVSVGAILLLIVVVSFTVSLIKVCCHSDGKLKLLYCILYDHNNIIITVIND